MKDFSLKDFVLLTSYSVSSISCPVMRQTRTPNFIPIVPEYFAAVGSVRTALPKKNPYPILMSSWDIHYKTWKNIDVPKILIKYENLLKDTNNVIQEIIKFFNKYYNIDFSNLEQKINNIIKTTNFDSFKKHEKKHGFNEAPYFYFKTGIAEYFFWEGKSDTLVDLMSS